ncbi:MAG: hypothetical protein Q9164_002032 [Protoblastenia rupestris]
MFSFGSSQAHAKRKRIIASAYSKTAISQPRIQDLIRSRTAKVVRFIETQTSNTETSHGSSGPIVVRNVFRALQSDIFTAFAFSDEDGTRYLNRLRTGPNTMEDLNMEDMNLLHDERRDEFFFWESEKPFKYIKYLVDRHGPKTHERAQRWLSKLVSKHEERLTSSMSDRETKKPMRIFDSGLYDKLQLWRSQETGRSLDRKERASEIMDHAVAGQDAVPAAMEYIVRQISEYPGIQSKLRLELLTLVPLTANDRTFAMIDTLPYLNAVVMEGLRTVDTISSYQTRVVPKRGCVVSDHFLPGGTIVASQPYLINRLPDVFPHPNSFDPDRWLLPRESYKSLAKHLWTYSSGPRSCIGRDLSLAIIKTMLVDIYTRFKTTLVNPDRTEKRLWEGADMMAEVQFEIVLACEEGDGIEKRSRPGSMYAEVPGNDTEQANGEISSPVRCSSTLFHRESGIRTDELNVRNRKSSQFSLREKDIGQTKPENIVVKVSSRHPSTPQEEISTGHGILRSTHQDEMHHLDHENLHQSLFAANFLAEDGTEQIYQQISSHRPSVIPSVLPMPLGPTGHIGDDRSKQYMTQRDDLPPGVTNLHAR